MVVGNFVAYFLKEDDLKELIETLFIAKDIVEDLFGETIIDGKKYRIITSVFDETYGDDLGSRLSYLLKNKIDKPTIKKLTEEIRKRKVGKIVVNFLIEAHCF